MRKRIYFALFSLILGITVAHACGEGYVLVDSREKFDGVKVVEECQKLWCMDFETGKTMGSGDKAASGYRETSQPNKVCDANGSCIKCWGARRWCAGEEQGEWNPEYGAYTRGGDNATYESIQKGSCFAWRLEKPQCENGKVAILQEGKWVCLTKTENNAVSRESSVRRTGSKRLLKF